MNTFDGTENPMGLNGWLPANKAPKGGYRTDRNNNPTAFTVDIALQGGLKQGTDFIIDPIKQAGFPTATLLDEPYEKTRRVLNVIGFYTAKGAQRWTHTAIPKPQWDGMTIDQKNLLITTMYMREGGTGILVPKVPVVESQPVIVAPEIRVNQLERRANNEKSPAIKKFILDILDRLLRRIGKR